LRHADPAAEEQVVVGDAVLHRIPFIGDGNLPVHSARPVVLASRGVHVAIGNHRLRFCSYSISQGQVVVRVNQATTSNEITAYRPRLRHLQVQLRTIHDMDDNPYKSPMTAGSRRVVPGLRWILFALAAVALLAALALPAFQTAEEADSGSMYRRWPVDRDLPSDGATPP
jgi:hypothetical protein